ncbi:MAG TPA: hypothetical protein VK921_12605 [Anditalea sp.]|nr:hypothetical protein [Anditalea sp.]
MSSTETHYRILFEAINKFSIAVFNAKGSEEVSLILRKRIKYLINCIGFEYYFISDAYAEMYSVTTGSQIKSLSALDSWMLELFHTGLPYYNTEEEDNKIREIRGWSFRKHENFGSIIVIKSDQHAPFTNRYITMVKLINEILCAKVSNNRLIEELGEKKSKIESLVLEQEQLIERRTKNLKESNQNLTQLIQFNTHQIREPITRAMSLMEIKDDMGIEIWEQEFWPDMQQAVSDLDDAVKSIVIKVDRIEHHNI